MPFNYIVKGLMLYSNQKAKMFLSYQVSDRNYGANIKIIFTKTKQNNLFFIITLNNYQNESRRNKISV